MNRINLLLPFALWTLLSVGAANAQIEPFLDAQVDGSLEEDEIDHDALNGFVANEHIDWTADQGGTVVHPNNYLTTTVQVDTGGALSTVDFQDGGTINFAESGGVITATINAGGVGSSQIATAAVGSDEIATDAVGSAEIATNAVDSDEIAIGAVGSAEIATAAVGSDEIATDAVGSAEIATDAVGSAEIATDAVGSGEIAANAVDSSEIAADAVGASELAATAVVAGVYTNTNLTVDADGRITAASNGTSSGLGEDAVQLSHLDDGTDTPLAGEFIQVDPVDTTQVRYRSGPDVIADLGLDADISSFTLPANTDISAFAQTLLDDAAAGNMRVTLELGTNDSPSFASITTNAGDVLINRTGDSANATLLMNADDGFQARTLFRTTGSARWSIRKTQSLETGSDAGSNFAITAFTDGGASKGDVFAINRTTLAASFSDDLDVGGALTVSSVAVPTISSTSTLTNKTIDGDNNTLSNLDLGNEVDWAAINDIADATAFASGDKIPIYEAGVGLRKIDFDDLPSGGASQLSGLSDVNTSTPTNRNALMADGVDWESRAIVAADISDADVGTFGRSITFSSNTASADAELYTHVESISIPDPAATDSGDVQLMFPLAATITRVACSTDTGTATIQFDERAAATPNTAGTDVMTSTLVCDNNEESTTSFDNDGIASRVPVNLDIDAVASSPTIVRIFVEYTLDD